MSIHWHCIPCAVEGVSADDESRRCWMCGNEATTMLRPSRVYTRFDQYRSGGDAA